MTLTCSISMSTATLSRTSSNTCMMRATVILCSVSRVSRIRSTSATIRVTYLESRASWQTRTHITWRIATTIHFTFRQRLVDHSFRPPPRMGTILFATRQMITQIFYRIIVGIVAVVTSRSDLCPIRSISGPRRIVLRMPMSWKARLPSFLILFLIIRIRRKLWSFNPSKKYL